MKTIIKEISKQITHLGCIVVYGVIIATTLLLEQYTLFWKLCISLIVIMFIGMGIKALYFKERPKKQEYFSRLEKIDASSFPSIHSARISALALILSMYFNKTLFTIFLTIVAICVMYSRIYLKKHRFVDIIGGAILGVLVGLVLVL
jgi:membrane-associated phospholipid phosphatase